MVPACEWVDDMIIKSPAGRKRVEKYEHASKLEKIRPTEHMLKQNGHLFLYVL